MTEEQTHLAVCKYIAMQYPGVIFNSDLSGVRLSKSQAIKAKLMRSSRAFPDLVIYEPRHERKGLFIELKKEGERLYKKDGTYASEHIKEQALMLDRLNDRGYMAVFAIGFEKARIIIDNYLKK